MGAFRGHVNLRPRRPHAARIAAWYAAREQANAARRRAAALSVAPSIPAPGNGLHAASASAMSGFAQPITRP